MADKLSRQEALNKIHQVMRDSKPRMARDIVAALNRDGVNLDKQLVNSILHNEGKNEFNYDRDTYQYSLIRESSPSSSKPTLPQQTLTDESSRKVDGALAHSQYKPSVEKVHSILFFENTALYC